MTTIKKKKKYSHGQKKYYIINFRFRNAWKYLYIMSQIPTLPIIPIIFMLTYVCIVVDIVE